MSGQWAFVAAAYAVALGGTGLLAAAGYAAMRRAEEKAERVLGARRER